MSNVCNVCDKLPLKRVKSIDKHLLAGKKSLMAIAEHYAVDIGDLRLHLSNCVKKDPVSQPSGELETNLQYLRTLITQFHQDIADGRHLRFNPEDGIDGRSIVNQTATLMREFRQTVETLERIRSADAIYDDLRETVVDPLINGTVQILIEEGRRLRDELYDLTKATPEHHVRIKTSVDNALTRMAERMTSEAIHDIPEKVRAVAGQRNQNRRPTTH